jgi:hypothetical protein
MPAITYPLDLTGIALGNKINNETHTLTEINATEYQLIVPTFAPFFVSNLSLSHISDTGVVTPMVEGVDYNLCMPFLGAIRSLGMALYGGIAMIGFTTGSVRINSYQTIGGSWLADINYVYQQLALNAYNPKIISWDQVTNVQAVFPPGPHSLNMDDTKGYDDLVQSVNNFAAAMLAKPTPTKQLMGLGNVPNWQAASDAEVAAHLPLDKYVSLRQVLQLLGMA